MRTLRTNVLLWGVTTLFGSCGFHIEKESLDTHLPGQAVPSFEQVKARVFGPRCAGCHGSARGNIGDVNCESYASVKERIFDIERVALTERTMPPGAPLDSEEFSLLSAWIKAGAPEQGSGLPMPLPSSSAPAPVPSEMTYNWVRERVFAPRCVACHGNSGGINLETYSAVKQNLASIVRVALRERSMPPGSPLSGDDAAALSAWIGAGAPGDENSVSPPIPSPAPSPEPDRGLFYQLVRRRIFLPSCVKCHGNSGGVNLETYSAIKGRLSDIERVTTRARTMPPTGPLPDAEIQLLSAWILAGAPGDDTTSSPSPRPSPTPIPPGPSPSPSPSPAPDEPLTPTFTSIRKNIFQNRCLVCHTHGQPDSKVPLGSRDELLNSPRELVIPGNPDESGLMIAVSRSDSKRMPPPDSGLPPLLAHEIATIRRWIAEGAKP